MNKEYLNILREDGIVTIPDYYDKHQCQKIISQIEKISLTKNVISKRDEGIGGDIRIFNFEDESSMGLQFAKNNFLQNLVSI